MREPFTHTRNVSAEAVICDEKSWKHIKYQAAIQAVNDFYYIIHD